MDIVLLEGSKHVILIEVVNSTMINQQLPDNSLLSYLQSLPGYAVGKVLSATTSGLEWISPAVSNPEWNNNLPMSLPFKYV